MFKVESTRIVKNWPATVSLPIDGGKVHEEKITLDLKLHDVADSNKLMRGDEELVKASLKGWSGIADADGNELAFNNENVELLTKNNYFIQAFFKAYQQAVSGLAAEKN